MTSLTLICLTILTFNGIFTHGYPRPSPSDENQAHHRSLSSIVKNMFQTPTKRCAPDDYRCIASIPNPVIRCIMLGDEACANGGIPGAGADMDWIFGGFHPGKRCAMLGDEACANEGLIGAASDNDFLNGGFNPGKRSVVRPKLHNADSEIASIPGAAEDNDWLHGDFTPGKRCAMLGDEACANAGLIDAASDNDWINSGFNPGKRSLLKQMTHRRKMIKPKHALKSINKSVQAKRCAMLGDEACANEGLIGAGSDSDFVNSGFNPGKRCAMLGDEACANGGLIGAGSDSDFVNSGFNPGKRCAMLGDEACANGGIPNAAADSEWINGGFNPGK